MHKVFQIYKLLLPYLWSPRKCRFATFLTLAFILSDVVATTYFPYIWKNIIAANAEHTASSWFISTVILLFATWIVKKASPHLREIFFFTVTNYAIKDIRYKTILQSHKVSIKDLEKYNVQEIISSTNRVSQSIRQFMRVSFISILPNASKITTLSVALYFSHTYSFWIVVTTFLSLITSSLILKSYTSTKLKGWHMTDNLAVAMNHSLQNTKSIRFQLTKETSFLRRLFESEAEGWARNNLAYYGLHFIRDITFYLGGGITFGFITLQYSRGEVALDQLVLIYGLITSLYTPLIEVSRNMTRFFGGIVDLEKTLDILSIPHEQKPIKQIPLKQTSITLKDVSFSYSSRKTILKDINLTIHPSDKIGLFGPSGTGKSTLCQILSGLTPPDSGQALLGNTPLHTIRSETLGKILCYIPQDHWCKDLEVLEDASYGVHLKHKTTSGGEYQRYLINKMLEEKPEIIILDETTNALDRSSIDTAISEIIEKVPTVIMITHRQSTLKRMNRILHLKNATLAEINSTNGDNTA